MGAAHADASKRRAEHRLLEHCAALGDGPRRPPARERLEAALGPELASRLVVALSNRSSRHL
jgi:hypothetical protein